MRRLLSWLLPQMFHLREPLRAQLVADTLSVSRCRPDQITQAILTISPFSDDAVEEVSLSEEDDAEDTAVE